LAPRARLELAALRLAAEVVKNLSAASGVAYMKSGAILTLLATPILHQEVFANSSRHLKCYPYNTASDNFRVDDYLPGKVAC
jgi:hypothetical protein